MEILHEVITGGLATRIGNKRNKKTSLLGFLILQPMQQYIAPTLWTPARSNINSLYCRCSTGYCLRGRVIGVRVWGKSPETALLILPHDH